MPVPELLLWAVVIVVLGPTALCLAFYGSLIVIAILWAVLGPFVARVHRYVTE